MIQLEKYYSFPAQDVEAVATTEATGTDFPFRLVVYLRSGRSLGVNYETEAARTKAKASLEARIDSELNGTDRLRDIQFATKIIDQTLRGMEKRQLRIFRMIKKLLPPTEGEPKGGEDL